MVRSFKFMSDNDYDDSDDVLFIQDDFLEGSASWIWLPLHPEDNFQYEIITVTTNGIREFLYMFPETFCVPIRTIVGPNGRINSAESEYEDGWGFDIQIDPITIQYYVFLPNNTPIDEEVGIQVITYPATSVPL